MRADEILKKRRDRACAIILGVKERELDPILKGTPEGDRASKAMRKAVLDQVNDFYDLALDIVNSSEAKNFEFNADVWMLRIEGTLQEGLNKIAMAAAEGGKPRERPDG